MSGSGRFRISIALVAQPEPIVVTPRLPPLELHDELDALRGARRRDAEEILDIDDAEPANFHVMPRQLRTGANQNRLGAPPHFDGVVGDETMAAHDQIERAFALPDAALADDEHAKAKDVEQHAVQQLADDEAVFEDGGDLRHGDRRRHQRPQHRQAAPFRFEDHLAEHAQPAGDQNARHFVVLAHLPHGIGAICRIQTFEIANLAVAEDEHAPFAQIFVEPRARGRFSACRG